MHCVHNANVKKIKIIVQYPFFFGSGRSLFSGSQLPLPPWWDTSPNWQSLPTRPPDEQPSGNRYCLFKQKQEQERHGTSAAWTYRVSQQVNTVICVIDSREPQALRKCGRNVFLRDVMRLSFSRIREVSLVSISRPGSWWANAKVWSSPRCLWVSSRYCPKRRWSGSRSDFWQFVLWPLFFTLTLIMTMWDSSRISRKLGFRTDKLMLGTTGQHNR